MTLIFASHNENKVREIRSILPDGYALCSLTDIDWQEEIPETAETLEGNALMKARAVYDATQKNCFADDTGLVVPSLNGEPGVLSARYAGPERSSEANMDKLLSSLEGGKSRKAYFQTSIALIINGKEHLFEGRVDGEILEKRSGTDGFGYDPIFRPDGELLSFAQMELSAKNSISHRARAFSAMMAHLAEAQ